MQEKAPKYNLVSRENFGPGMAGEKAFLAIASGAVCESKTTHKDKQNPLGDRTVGFDIGGAYDFVVVCSEACEQAVRNIIEKELLELGRVPSFDKNGFGRA
jgi:hypothetical protein